MAKHWNIDRSSLYSLSQDILCCIFGRFLIKNKHTCKRSVIEIDERQNFQDNFIHILLICPRKNSQEQRTYFLRRFLMGYEDIFPPFESHSAYLAQFLTLSAGYRHLFNK